MFALASILHHMFFIRQSMFSIKPPDQIRYSNWSIHWDGVTASVPYVKCLSKKHLIALLKWKERSFCSLSCCITCIVYFGVVKNLPGRLLDRTFGIDNFGSILLTQCYVIPVWSIPLAIISEYSPLSDLMAWSETDREAKNHAGDWQDQNNRTQPFQVVRCLTILPNTKVSVSVTSSSAGLIHMAPHPILTRNRMLLPASRIINPLPHILTSIKVDHFPWKQIKSI